MAVLVTWTEPRSVVDWEWRNKIVPLLKFMAGIFVKWTLILSVPLLLGTVFWARFAVVPALLGLICTGIIFPIYISSVFLFYKLKRQCEIGDKVLCRRLGRVGYYGSPFTWPEVDSYRFLDHPALPQVRCLAFKLKKRKSEVTFNFNPDEVEEQQLQSILLQQRGESAPAADE